MLVDTRLLRAMSGEFAGKMAALEKEAHEAAGHPFNIGSPKQLQEVLYNELKLPVTQYTPTKQPSTNEDALAELAEQHRLPKLILDYRSLSKLKSTYTDKLPEQVCARTGRIHTSYHQAVAATGRLSSSDPNLQNIPIRTEEGRRIRQAFIPKPGCTLLAADYSQIELRIMAHLSEDEGLLKAFAADKDVHQATAAEVFGVPLEAVTTDQRRSAKAINFGLIYGMSAFGLARQLGIAPGRGAEVRGPVLRPLSRREGLHGPHAGPGPGAGLRGNGLRPAALPAGHPGPAAVPAPVRGTQRHQRAHAGHGGGHHQEGHDQRGRTGCGRAAPAPRSSCRCTTSWCWRCRQPPWLRCRSKCTRLMSGAADLRVPLKVDAGHGANWDEAH